jgi:hypothetical protein
MKRPNITPESWHIGKRAGAEHGAIYGAKGEEIALPLGFFMDDQEAKANARAIAALPDLLAALETSLSIIEDIPHPGNYAAESIRQALVKAGYTF